VNVLVHTIFTSAGVDIICFFIAMLLFKLLLVRPWFEPLILVPLKIKILSGGITSHFIPPAANTSNPTASNVNSFFISNVQGVLLGSALVEAIYNGVTFTCRALIDLGSVGTSISEKLFRTTKISYTKVQARFSGLKQAVASQTQKMCQFSLGSSHLPRIQVQTSANLLPFWQRICRCVRFHPMR